MKRSLVKNYAKLIARVGGNIQKGQEVCLGQRTVLIRADKGKVNPAYLTYYLLAPKQQHDLKSSANGATVGHINMPVANGIW